MKALHYSRFAILIVIISTTKLSYAQDWKLIGNADATSSSKLGTTNKIPLRIFTNNQERMRLDTQGRFGIGTITPAFTLDVSNFKLAQVARFNGPTSKMYIGLWKTNGLRGYVGSNQPNTYDMDFGTSSNNTQGSTHLIIKGLPKLSVAASGNVGIGTLAPMKKLEVADGDLRLNMRLPGILHSMEFMYQDSRQDWRIEHALSGYEMYFTVSPDNFLTVVRPVVFLTSPFVAPFSLTVFGRARAAGFDLYSDKKLKKNIEPVSSALELVKKLNPQQYYFKSNEYPVLALPANKQYGFVAQEVEDVFPELVTEAEIPVDVNVSGEKKMEMVKSINYMMLIPILTKSIQEQQEEIAGLKNELAHLKDLVKKISNGQAVSSRIDDNSIGQNNPNPVRSNTSISYSISSLSKGSKIILTDKSGKIIRSIGLNGSGTLNLDAGMLSSGTYTYSLIVDGVAVQSRTMLVAR
jgi:hypothetical protein